MNNTVNKATWLIGGTSAIAWFVLVLNSQNTSLAQLLATAAYTALASFWLLWHAQLNGQQVSIWLLLGFAVLFRLIGFFSLPILEDDFYRYLWDGRMTWEFGSAYGVAPLDLVDSESLNAKFESILDGINYPGIATIYGPTNQWLFAFAYWIAPGELWPLKLMFIAADLLLIYLLLQLAKPNWVLLYAWSPLVIKEFAFTAHPDIVGALFLFLAFLAFRNNRQISTGVFLGLAAGVKIFALPVVPLLCGWRWRSWLAFVLAALVIAAPFGVVKAWFPAGLQAMGGEWLFNAPIYFLLLPVVPVAYIKLALAAVFLCVYAVFYLHNARRWPNQRLRLDWLLLALFIIAPALNPWYWVWLLPFAVLYPGYWAWTGSVSLFLAYVSGINLADSKLQLYQQPGWLLIIEFALIALAVFYDLRRGRSRN